MNNWHLLSMKAIITGEKRCVPEEKWVPMDGIEPPSLYHIYATKTHKKYIREKLENEENKLTF